MSDSKTWVLIAALVVVPGLCGYVIRDVFAKLVPLDRWPLGVNPVMDEHARRNGLPHWSCVDPTGNFTWARCDGLVHTVKFGGPSGYLGELRALDASDPLVQP